MDAYTIQKALSAAATQGPWCIFFIALLFYVLRDSSRRENRLMDYLSKLDGVCSDILGVKQDVTDMKNDVKVIKAVILRE